MELLIVPTLNDFFEQDLGSDKEVFNSLLGILESHSAQLSEFSPNLSNLEDLAKLAHKIKSGTTSFGADKLSIELKELEIQSTDKKLDTCLKLLEQVQRDFDETLTLIREWKIEKGF